MKQVLRFLALAALICVPWVTQAQTLVTIGEGTSTTYYPMPGFFGFQYDVYIYTPSEAAALGADCDISSIAWYISTNSTTSDAQMTIWVKDVDDDYALATETTFAEYTTDATQVYNTDDLSTTTGWNTFGFSSTFSHEGGKALLVAVRGVGCTTGGGCSRNCRYTSKSSTHWGKRADSSDPGTSATGSIDANRSNIQLAITYTGSVCLTPSGMTSTNVTHNSANLTWNENGSADGWVLQYGIDNTFATYTEETVNTTPPYSLTGLTPLTTYYARVKPDCDNDDSHWSTTCSFSTTAVATVVGDSWSDDFEGGSCGWELVNGTLTNANWAWGTAASNGGTHALYISNDNGITNDYNASGYAKVYAIKLLSFNASKYKFHFDWKCVGETSYDYLSVGLVPASTQLTADNTSASSLPTGWIALHDAANLSAQATWQTSPEKTIQLEAGSYYLVFRWRQDSGTKNGVPAAVDNVSITKVACPYDVEDLEVADDPAVTTTTATINWTAGEATQWQVMWSTESNFPVGENTHSEIVNAATKALTGLTASTNYYVKVRAYCGGEDYGEWCDPINFPTACEAIEALDYTENFESYTTGNNVLPVCWNYINTTTYSSYQGYPKVYNYSANSPSNCLYLYSYAYYYGSTTTYDPQPQYAILPEMTGLAGKQVTLWAKGYYATSTFKIGTMSDPTDASTFEPIEITSGVYEQALTTSYQEFEYIIPATTDAYLAIMIDAATSSRTSNGVYIDDISIANPPTCAKPTSFTVSDVTSDQATISWTENGTAESWQYSLNDGEPVTVTTNPYTITGLTALTSYTIKLRADCGGSQSEYTAVQNFSTTAVATIVGDSWSDDFEGDACGWELVNGTITNKWAWGTAAANGGSKAIYISNDDGASNVYNNGSAAMVYATKLLNFTDGKYQFTYDWKANGESTYDYLRVALVPASTTLTAGASYPSGFGTSTLPTGWIALDGGSKLNLVTSWQNKNVVINMAAGNYYLVLAWRNDGTGGTQPPAAVDNVSITKMACPYDVTGLAESNITTTGATVTWTAGEAEHWQVAYGTDANFDGATESIVNAATANLTGLTSSTVYYVRVRAYCGGTDYGSWSDPISFQTECEAITTFPYTQNFDSYTTGNNVLPICWSYINTSNNSTYKNYPKVYNSNANSPSNCLYLYSYAYYSGGTTTYDPQPQYAILPEMTGLAGKQVTLQAKGNYATSTFKIGTMSDPTDASSFTLITEQTLTTSYQEFSYIVPSTTNAYLAIMIDAATSSRTSNGVYIDDITVEEIPSCLEPSNLEVAAASITTTSAEISWIAGSTEPAWDIYYSENNEAPTNVTTPSVAATSDNPATLDGLDPATTYYVWVRAHCSDVDQSPWIGGVSFTTECEPYTITAATPYIQDFEDPVTTAVYNTTTPADLVVPACWDNYTSNTSSAYAIPHIIKSGADYNYSSPDGQVLYFYGSGNGYAALPEFSNDWDELQINFKYATEGSSQGTLTLGYITTADNGQYNSFTEIMHIDASSASDDHMLQAPTVYLGGLPANATRLVFRWYYSSWYGANIDDIKVSLITKDITANSWYAISSPVHNSGNNETVAGVTNLTSGTYDLLGYDETNATWKQPSDLERGKGYIYRNAADKTLTFNGTANSGNIDVTLEASAAGTMKGWNLLGNPYAHTYALTRDCYSLSASGTWTVHAGSYTMAVAEAVLVKSNGETFHFTETPATKSAPASTIAFTVSNDEFTDIAYARFSSEEGLPKISHLNPEAPMLSIDGYAIANLNEGTESFPMSFSGQGSYTLTVSGNTDVTGYLHLVDRLTGRDIDLLSTPSYSFTGSPVSDRFTVKLTPDANEGNSTSRFAIFDGNSLIVNGEGTLEVYDVMGRRLMSAEVTGSEYRIPGSDLHTGVYVLRMNGNSQKIVIK